MLCKLKLTLYLLMGKESNFFQSCEFIIRYIEPLVTSLSCTHLNPNFQFLCNGKLGYEQDLEHA